MIGYKKYKTAIRAVKEAQKDSLKDDYNVGLYNGLELALAILEGRNPSFECTVGEPPVIENNEREKTNRTLYGNRKRKV